MSEETTKQSDSLVQTSPELNELAKSLATAQGEFTAIPKDADNLFFKSKYADLASVIKTASPILAKNKLAITQHLGFDGEHNYLTTWLLHESGQWMRSTMRLYLAKQDPQTQGSATTYARRYSYMAVLGLAADEDDDGNSASGNDTSKDPKAPAKRPSAPQASANKPASDKQRDLISTLAKKAGYGDDWIANAFMKVNTSADASALIERLQNSDKATEGVGDAQ